MPPYPSIGRKPSPAAIDMERLCRRYTESGCSWDKMYHRTISNGNATESIRGIFRCAFALALLLRKDRMCSFLFQRQTRVS
jgi:hypothetical protein